jgi:gliding motility-associated-like protein
LYLTVSSTGQNATVTISQPANASFTPIVVNVLANKSVRVNLTPYKSMLETRPTNSVVNTGLRIVSTTSITCYYECANTNNTDIWALKGPNGLGTEFYIPLHKHAPFYNFTFASPHQAFASFDICATENNTTVTIYSPTPVDGHAALQQFQVTLNQGQTYSCGFTGTNYTDPLTHPSGAVVLANKPITVSLKDDSNKNPSGGCYDILGDQIVPTDVVGEDYIAVKGNLNATGDESVVLMATENNTQVYLDGSTTPAATLFAGEYFRIDLDYLATASNNSTYIHCTAPTYAMHITGFGCEMGMAQLPPLNCAGSQTLNFVRGSNQTFYLTVLCRAAAINSFTVTGPGTATIPGSAFVTVPGTGGEWQAARISYNTTQIPVDSTFKVTNSVDVFALGLVNGGASSGCKYGYFSEFVAPITSNAGPDQTICANTSATLSGAIAGGTTTGIWTSTGTGAFTPSNTDLNAVYTPSAGDASLGSVTLTLTSTGACTPVSDAMTLTISPAPTANAGANQTVCANNANISLNGSITVATGGVWTGGAGTFIPSNSSLNPEYIPTASEIASGSLLLTLTTTGNGICNEISDNILITFSPAPVVNAGIDQTKCGNNPTVTLAGSISVATGGVWTGGSGSFSPSATTLNATYTASAAEIAAGSVTLTLTSTGNGLCLSEDDQMTIFFTAAPTANAGVDQTKCANNATTVLAGSVTIASGGQWSGGLGIFSPSTSALGATYTPSAGEIAAGSVTLTLTTTGNNTCSSVTDQMTITFTPAPTVNAGSDIVVCANNNVASLNATYTIASGIVWSGGAGTFSPNNTTANATYTPTATEIATGSVTLTCTSTGNGLCNQVSDQVLITITPAPIVNAGLNIAACANNAAVSLNGQVFNATGGSWSGGSGSYFPSNNSLNATYTPSAGEIANGSVTLTLTSTGNAFCNAVSDDVIITFAPTPIVNAGNDQTVCGNNAAVDLVGFVNFASGGQWSGGLGIYSPSANALNAEYNPTVSEIANGFVDLTLTSVGNGTCIAVTDVVRINFTPSPSANAGLNITSCENNADVLLNGSFTVATGAVWSGGSGNFVPSNTAMNASYQPSATEIANGSVNLTLTTSGNGTCLPESDNVLITIIDAPSVNAGENLIICVDDLDVALSGSISGPTNTGVWSTSGTGTFIPNNTSLNAIYQCSSADSLVGSVTITLTSTNNQSCNAISDQMVIDILPAGIANAGADEIACSNNANIELNGIVSGGATSGTWSSSGTGTFSPDVNTLNATYVPSLFDISTGQVTLTLSANSCNTATDELIVNFTQSSIVDAGADFTICQDETSFQLDGSVSTGTGIWTTNGTGTFSPSNTALNATYTFSTADISNSNLTFTLTSTFNGICSPVSDDLTVSISQVGTAIAGFHQTLCSNNPNATLSAMLTGGATAGIWTSNGTGLFIPNPTDPNATYVPGQEDLLVGNVQLNWTTTNSCNEATDYLIITYTPAPSVSAGQDQFYCGLTPTFQLEATLSNALGLVWSGGSGTFSPNNTSPNAIYTPSASEIATGIVTLTATTTGNGNCIAEFDQVQLTMTPGIQINAGQDQEVCITSQYTQLQGIVSNGSTTGTWQTLGSGTFGPDENALNAIYYFSEADTTAGTVTLILTSTNNGGCPPQTDIVTITFGESALALAGEDNFICETTTSISLNGIISGGASAGQWSSTGNGTISDITDMNAEYVITPEDIANGSITFSLITTDNGTCQAGSDEVTYTIENISSVTAGNDVSICSTNLQVPLGGNISGASSQGVWTTNGSGYFTPDSFWGNGASYIPSSTDSVQGNVTLTLTAINTQACPPSNDSFEISIYHPIESNAGFDIQVCASNEVVQLNGSTIGTTSFTTWSTNGDGYFTPNNTSIDATYTLGENDVINGSVSLNLTAVGNPSCPIDADQTVIFITSPSNVSAGNDVTICSSNLDVPLGGSITGASNSGTWSSTGSGSFVPNNDFASNPMYLPSASDSLQGSVQLILTSNNAGNCTIDSDTLVVTILHPAIVNAGADISTCALDESVDLNGTFGGGTTGIIWTSNGSGSFSPDATSPNTTYTFGNSDISNGTVELVIQAAGNSACPSASDTLTLTLVSESIVTAGGDVTVCSSDMEIPLGGNISGASSSGFWSTLGSGSFTPNNDYASNPTYIPSASDSIQGSVLLVLTSNNTGSCLINSDTLLVTIIQPSMVNAGTDQTVCASDAAAVLNGVISGGSTSGIWSTTGSGTFTPDANTLNAVYNASSADAVNGSVFLILTSTGNGVCSASDDSLTLTITPNTLVNAGSDRVLCGSDNQVDLTGIISGNSTEGIWTTNGTGSFSPSPVALSTTYTLSNSDIIAGDVTLYLTTTNNLQCGAVVDSLTISIEEMPTAAFSSFSNDSLNVAFTDESIGAAAWFWEFGNGATSTQQNPSLQYAEAGVYEVMLTITSGAGCQDSIISFVEAYEKLADPIALPTAFSPNGDNNNDVLHILGGPFETVEFKVYNGWGNLVYSTTDPKGGWDGTFQGQDQPVGVYVCTVSGVTIEGKTLKLSGNITLIR